MDLKVKCQQTSSDSPTPTCLQAWKVAFTDRHNREVGYSAQNFRSNLMLVSLSENLSLQWANVDSKQPWLLFLKPPCKAVAGVWWSKTLRLRSWPRSPGQSIRSRLWHYITTLIVSKGVFSQTIIKNFVFNLFICLFTTYIQSHCEFKRYLFIM